MDVAADDQPVVYPPADVFQELTTRRKRYTSTDLKKVSPAEKRIREALAEPTKMEFNEMPLQDAVTFIKDYHAIEIQLDTRALEDAGGVLESQADEAETTARLSATSGDELAAELERYLREHGT